MGFVVFQKAKLRVLLFCYDCLDKFLARPGFGLLCDTVEEAVRLKMLEGSLGTTGAGKPGLFKIEFEGSRGIALCSKCYFKNGKMKVSSKGVSERQNQLNWERYKKER